MNIRDRQGEVHELVIDDADISRLERVLARRLSSPAMLTAPEIFIALGVALRLSVDEAEILFSCGVVGPLAIAELNRALEAHKVEAQ